MKETLILITAALRLDNLIHIAKSINKYYNDYTKYFDIYWIICKDQYNGFGSLDNAIKYLNDTNIQYKIYNSGKPSQKNYGGDLFNEPLISFVDEYNLDNPWVYILDDDNIIHPRLFKVFKICCENDFYGNKEIISTINKWHCGHNREISADSIFRPINKTNFIDEWGLHDPSQVILRYSIIKKYNYYDCNELYDFYWLNIPILFKELENNNIIFYNDYDAHGRHIVSSYHNGLVTKEQINNFLNENISDINIDILLQTDNVELPQNIPILNDNIKHKIIKLIKEEYG